MFLKVCRLYQIILDGFFISKRERISRKLWRFLCFLSCFPSFSVLLLVPVLITFIFMHRWTDEILLINPYTNVFVFGDFNVHHKDWLICSAGSDGPGELCYNFYISNDVTHMVTFPAWIPKSDFHSPFFWIHFFWLEYLFDIGFSSSGKFNHFVVSVSIDFLSNSKGDFAFHCIAYDHSCVD